MVSTPEGLIENSLMPLIMYVLINNLCEIKSLRQFFIVFNVKQMTAACRLGDAKYKRKAIRTGNMMWSST